MSSLDAAPDAEYTSTNHVFREHDRYAEAKYHLTLRWLSALRPPMGTLINVGCGYGTFNKLAIEAGYHVVACEPDLEAYSIARAAAPAGCIIECLTLTALADSGVRGDVVVAHDVIEHIQNDTEAVNDMARMLQPGGLLALSVPAHQWLNGRHDRQLGHFRRYTKQSLVRQLRPQFEPLRMRYSALLSIPIVLLYSVFLGKDYPMKTASSALIGSAYGAVCTVETYLPEPVGTTLIAIFRRHDDTPMAKGARMLGKLASWQ